jgi:tripartite-type tricarboxylate transporter receptor subunit TctC
MLYHHAMKNFFALLLSAAAMLGSTAIAQTFPSKPIKLVVPFSPGSTNDIVARALGDKLHAALGQPILVENRAGAGGTLGTGVVASAAPDGYTLLVTSSNHTISPAMMSKLPFDSLKDFSAVATLVAMPVVLVVSAQGKFNTVAELIAYGKANPMKLNFASAGAGSSTHMNAEKFRLAAGIEAVHIPYKGTGDAMTEIMAGRVDYMFAPLASAMSQLQGGKLKALAVGTKTRLPQFPNVPTTTEAGVSDYLFWVGLLAPAKTPRPVVQRVNDELRRILEMPDVKERFDTLGARAFITRPEEFDAFIREEMATNQKVVTDGKLKKPE